MINITRKEDCCGCGACYDACSKKAILWEADDEGFSYPRVDTSLCINCGLCNKVCPIENSEQIVKKNERFAPIVFAAYHKDENVRFTSTSGGAFWGLAEKWIREGGYVAGAVWSEHFKVAGFIAENFEQLEKIKGSKYVQADYRGLYRDINKLLINGEKVLATGLPCQMAALRQYLRKDYDNLLIVDLICHSVTSPLAFDKYVEWLERRNHSKLISYHPKNKEYGGWHKFAFKATFKNGKTYVRNNMDDPFTEVFVGYNNILCRYSCYECHYKNFPQPSDITIGDFWGIEKIDPDFDSPKGVSKVIINNAKGLSYFRSLDCFETREYDAEAAVYNNPRSASMIRSVTRCDQNKRAQFVQAIKERDFEKCVNHYLRPSKSFIQMIKSIVKRIKRIIKG
jgi:coenzyme F420-reducing hydrogenase beta subunit